jgi:hypothetical protein|tara:strand:+ start:73 stop:192 length:120 start_codon:yes stop_codon:yes gene_type:complete
MHVNHTHALSFDATQKFTAVYPTIGWIEPQCIIELKKLN